MARRRLRTLLSSCIPKRKQPQEEETEEEQLLLSSKQTSHCIARRESFTSVVSCGADEESELVAPSTASSSNDDSPIVAVEEQPLLMDLFTNYIASDNVEETLAVSNTERGMSHLPQDIWREICMYVSDPVTLCQLACVSKDLNQSVRDVASHAWKGLYARGWVRSNSAVPPAAVEGIMDWKVLFQKRYAWEGHVVRTLHEVVDSELQADEYDFETLKQRSNGHIASTSIDNRDWQHLIHNSVTESILDVLCATANSETSFHPAIERLVRNDQSESEDKQTAATALSLQRFLAASTAFTFHCQEVVTEMSTLWERSLMHRIMNPSLTTTAAMQADCEETVILLAHALRTVPNLLQRNSSLSQLKSRISHKLDQIAQMVLRYVNYYNDKSTRVEDCNDDSPPPSPTPSDDSSGSFQNNLAQHRTNSDRSFRKMSETRKLLFTIHYVLSKHYGIRYHLPVRRRSAMGGDDEVVHCCSIAQVLDMRPRDETSSDSHYNWCHPLLVAVLYQAVARRVGLMGDILFCPQNSHSVLRFASSHNEPVLFIDLVQDPGRIMTLAQCQELIRQCDLITEQQYQERRSHQDRWPDDVDVVRDDLDEDVRNAFWSQPPVSIPNLVYWLAAPFLVKRQPDSLTLPNLDFDSSDMFEDDDDEDQPYDFLLGQLVEGNGGGGQLFSFLQDRLVFFSSIMRHCRLIS